MESVGGDVSNGLEFLGGGWLSIVVGLLLALFLGYMKHAEKKSKREAAEKETDLNRQKEQAQTSDENNELQDSWDEGANEIDEIRKNRNKPGGGTP